MLDQLDTSDFKENGIQTTKDVKWDELQFQKLDLQHMTNTLILSFREDPNDDITLLPLQVFIDLFVKFRPGFGIPWLGPVPELTSEIEKIDAKLHTCQFVKNPYSV